MSIPSRNPVRSLYVHVPFCAKKCGYCAFYSEASEGQITGRYVEALIRELEWVAGDCSLETVFFGGGTPSLLSLRHWGAILGALERHGLSGAAEWTVECNPATVSADKARLLRDHGVNRISMGVQTLDEGLLERLGRVHTRDMVFRSYDILRAAGFENINLDLMFAIPGQTLKVWDATLDEIFAMGSEHLSCYEVIYEEDTPLYSQLQAGEFDVDESLACGMYDRLLDRAAERGFRQYEVANFARNRQGDGPEDPSLACRHNINYWRGGSFHGLGPSAVSLVDGERRANGANTLRYCEQVSSGEQPVAWTERLSPLGRAGEVAAFGLRMNDGWPFEEFHAVTGFDLREGWSEEMDRLQGLEYGVVEGGRFHLTGQGLRYADWAAELFLRT